MNLLGTSNCGIYEIEGIRSFDSDAPLGFFEELNEEFEAHQHDWKYPGIVLFSDARPSRSRYHTHGDALADYIMTNHLGELTWSAWKRNPNTGNHIKMWMWYPAANRLDKHIVKLRRQT